MGLRRRLVGVFVLLLAVTGTLCCFAGIVGTWLLRQEVAERVQRVAGRLDGTLQRVSAANQNVRLAVDKARADVAEVGKESADLGSGTKSRVAARTIRTLIQQQAGPNIDELGGRLATLSDSAVVVSSLLEAVQEVPLVRASRIDLEQLKQRAEEAQRLSSILRRLEVVVEGGDRESSKQEVGAVTSKVDVALQKCQTAVDAWQSDLDAVGDELARGRCRCSAG